VGWAASHYLGGGRGGQTLKSPPFSGQSNTISWGIVGKKWAVAACI